MAAQSQQSEHRRLSIKLDQPTSFDRFHAVCTHSMKIHRSRMAAEVVVVAAVEAEKKTKPAVEAGAVVEESFSGTRRWSLYDPDDRPWTRWFETNSVLAEERQERSVAPLPTDTTLYGRCILTENMHKQARHEMQETQQEESVP
jgi:hypothetical protein